MGDPYFDAIMDELLKVRDDKLFEECVVPLLQPSWPNLMPVPGGGDRGLDGAWTDAAGPGLLVTTTSPQVLQNLRKNLTSHVRSGGQRRQVLIATSRDLSPDQCRKLDAEAEKLGFQLAHQPYSRQAIAELLYNKPAVCKRLLGLSGRMSALGRVPKGARLAPELPLIGRDPDLQWLRSTEGDRALIGQPGSGKTYLLQSLARAGQGLFVLDENLDHLTDAVREHRPAALLVDDAHLNPPFLQSLISLRTEIDAEFDIVAATWPGARDEVRDKLSLPDSRVHELRPLSRQHILEIVNAAGVHGPNPLLHQLVRQANGRPGLAGYLAHLCVQGDALTVWKGDALARRMKEMVKGLVDQKAPDVLAAFSLGGPAGMRWQTIASTFGMSVPELRMMMSGLEAGGLLTEVDGTALAVQPEALRCILVRDAFFAGGTSLDVNALLPHVPDRNSAAMTLVGAYARGAKITSAELVATLESGGNTDAWRQFVWTDPENARIVLERYPEKLLPLARALLDSSPDLTLPHLFERASSDLRPAESWSDHPLRVIRDWVDEGEPGTDQPLARRERVLDAAVRWLLGGGDVRVGTEAMCAAFSPRFEDQQSHPANDYAFALRRGLVSESDLRTLAGWWGRALDVLRQIRITDWRPLLKMVERWCFPQQYGGAFSVDVRSVCLSTAAEILSGLASISGHQPGVQSRLKRLAEAIGADLDAEIDPEFSSMFPQDRLEPGQWCEELEKRAQDVAELAARWVEKGPAESARRFCELARAAEMVGIDRPDQSVPVAESVAQRAAQVLPWLDAMVEAGASANLVYPFLKEAAARNQTGWLDRAVAYLSRPELRPASVIVILVEPLSPPGLVASALSGLSGMHHQIDRLCSLGKIPNDRVLLLLSHPDQSIAAAATKGLARRPMTDDVRKAWRRSVVENLYHDYELGDLFDDDSLLAGEWLRVVSTRDLPLLIVGESPIEKAVCQLDRQQRIELLDVVQPVYTAAAVLDALIGTDVALYAMLLSDRSRGSLHLLPLRILPDGTWPGRALAALEAGYSPEAIAEAASPSSLIFSVAKMSDRYGQLADVFAKHLSHPDSRVREIARIGHRCAITDRGAAIRREEQWEAQVRR